MSVARPVAQLEREHGENARHDIEEQAAERPEQIHAQRALVFLRARLFDLVAAVLHLIDQSGEVDSVTLSLAGPRHRHIDLVRIHSPST